MSSPISGFTAIPNPYMIPLLFLQSLLIGAGFGIGYQGERRKLSAMSNDKFNELDLGMHAFNQFKEILARNDFGKMLDLMHPLTKQLAEAFGQFINQLPQNVASVVNEATGGFNFNIPTGFGGGALVGAPAGSGFTGSGEGFDTYLKFLQELNKEGKTFETPKADTQTAVYQYALKWMNPSTGIAYIKSMTQGEAKYILGQISKGNLNDFKRWRTSLIKHMDSFNVKPITPKEQQVVTQTAINTSTTQGSVVQKISTMFNQLTTLIAGLVIQRRKRNQRAIALHIRYFTRDAKTYNRFVQSNRHRNLTVDVAKSIEEGKIIKRF